MDKRDTLINIQLEDNKVQLCLHNKKNMIESWSFTNTNLELTVKYIIGIQMIWEEAYAVDLPNWSYSKNTETNSVRRALRGKFREGHGANDDSTQL